MRIAVLGAFPFPFPQGSQVFAAQQTQALADAGAEVCLLSYGRGIGSSCVPQRVIPTWLAPRRRRSGPHWGKPAADLALLYQYLQQHRLHPFDLALAHNAEAAGIGIAARRLTGVPIIYVAHTLLAHELSAYGPGKFRSTFDAIGGAIDARLARHSDGIVALSDDCQQTLLPDATGPIRILPPGLNLQSGPDSREQEKVCARHGLKPRQFTFYSGNLDRYQDLDLLSAASERIADPAHPIVIGTHDASNAGEVDTSGEHAPRLLQVNNFDEMRTLSWAAHSLVLTRRRPGGFPVKLLNYMETGRPIVAFERTAVGLEHDHSGWLLDPSDGAPGFAHALSELRRNPTQAERLGAAARQHLKTHHSWSHLGEAILDFAKQIVEEHLSPSCDETRGGLGRPSAS